MKVSLNTIKQFIDFELPPVDELVQTINMQLGVAEDVVDLNDKYKDATIVRVVECEKHPDADKLSVCKIDAGEDELVQVVCGAPNVHADMWVVWLPPKATVPATYNDEQPFVLDARKLRGIMSYGMLSASDELAIGSDHDGIVEITEDDLPQGVTLTPGARFADVFSLNDTIIDIENKMFTHRPDLFGQLGVAREIAGITGHEFRSPDWYMQPQQVPQGSDLELAVSNDAQEKVPRFMTVVLKDVTVRPSPLWLQTALVAMGSKPINNVVDITNYMMLITAQPTHAYDYDKLRGKTLGVRMAKDGESAKLLNGKKYTFTTDDIVIVDGEGVVGLGGIMGAGEAEVSNETKNIVLEVATFDMYTVRKSSMRHGIFTDALTRFNKGQSPLQNDRILSRLVTLVEQMSDGVVASDIVDLGAWDEPRAIAIDNTFIDTRLKLNLDSGDVAKLLRNVEFIVASDANDTLTVTPPFWRTDIVLPEDIVEEVGRLHGFDRLPRELPVRTITPAIKNDIVAAKNIIRTVLARAGANEVLTYSFVHENVLRQAGQDAGQAFQLTNALSPDLQYYRLSVLPSLLDKVHMNSRAGYDEFILFEIGKAHHTDALDEDKLPQEFGRVAGVYASKTADNEQGAAYYKARYLVEYLQSTVISSGVLQLTRLDAFEVPDFRPFQQMIQPFDPVRSAIVTIDGKLAGVVGELRPSVAKAFKLPKRVAAFELFLSSFVGASAREYQPLSRYPSVSRDICFAVGNDVTYQTLRNVVEQALAQELGIATTLKVVDIYQPTALATRHITFAIDLVAYDRTLDGSEVNVVMSRVTDAAVRAVGATVV